MISPPKMLNCMSAQRRVNERPFKLKTKCSSEVTYRGKGRYGEREAAHMTALQQQEQTDSSVCLFSQEPGGWQAAATFICHTYTEKHLTQTPNRLRNNFLHIHTCHKFRHFVLLNCAQIKIILPWGDAKCSSHCFSFILHITQKGNLPCLQPPLVSRRALCLPVYRHSRLNTLSSGGCFLSKASLCGGSRAWIYCLNNILHPFTSAMTQRHNRT